MQGLAECSVRLWQEHPTTDTSSGEHRVTAPLPEAIQESSLRCSDNPGSFERVLIKLMALDCGFPPFLVHENKELCVLAA